MTLGEFIMLLAGHPADLPVVFSGAGISRQVPGEPWTTFPPRYFDSYRGRYDELALTHGEPAVLTWRGLNDKWVSLGPRHVPVEVLLAEARAAVGKTFHGYKGGEFTMGPGTPLWVAQTGTSSGIVPLSMRPKCGKLVITVAYIGDYT